MLNKNILFLNFSFDIGGIETLILEICKHIDRDKYNIHICSFQEENILEAEFNKLNIIIYKIPKKSGIDFSMIFKINKLCKKLNIDIIHTHNAAQWLYGVLACLSMHKVTVIHTQHSIIKNKHIILFNFLKVLSLRTRFIISVADYISEYLIKKAKIKSKKIVRIYNGIDINKFMVNVEKKQKKDMLGISDNCFLIGIIARLVSLKRHDILMEAFKICLEKVQNIKLIIVGDGELKDKLLSYSKELNIENDTIFLGNRRDVPEILKILDLFVLCSDSEGLSMTLIETMAAGVPIIATNVGGNKEIIENAVSGYLINPADPKALADSMYNLIINEKARNIFSNNALNVVKRKFSINDMIKKYCDLYELSFKK